MAIAKGHLANLATLELASREGNIGLMECTDNATGEKVIVVVARSTDAEGWITLVPLAKMFSGNPYEEITPPAVSPRPAPELLQ